MFSSYQLASEFFQVGGWLMLLPLLKGLQPVIQRLEQLEPLDQLVPRLQVELLVVLNHFLAICQ